MTYRSISQVVAVGFALTGAARAESTQGYTVHNGDGLDAIARQRHTSRATLLRLNPLVTPDNLDIGAVVRVPAGKPTVWRVQHKTSIHPPVTVTPIAVHKPIPAKRKPIVAAVVQPPVAKAKLLAVRAAAPKPKAAPASAPAPAKTAVQPKAVASALGHADPYKYDEPQKSGGDMPIGRVIVDLIWKLAVVLGIAYLAIYMLRGIMGRQVGLPGQKSRLKVLESATLGPNRAVHLVRVGNKILVLGSTPDQITAIGEMDEADAGIAATPISQMFSGHLAEAVSGEKGGALHEHFHGGVRHIWDRVQEIRGLRGKGPNA